MVSRDPRPERGSTLSSALCRACDADTLKPLFTVEHVPAQSYLFHAAADRPVPVTDLRVYECGSCSMVQLSPGAAHDVEYEDTLVDFAFSPSYQRHFAPLAEEFAERFHLSGRSVVEIGAGTGFFSELLVRRGVRVSAIEPSRLAQVELARKGVPVVAGLLHDAAAQSLAGTFDGIVLLHVVEHVWDFRGFLAQAYGLLRDGAGGVVEVPSLEDAVENLHLHCFYPEHVNYFSLTTLHDALRRAGFHVLEIERVRQREYLRAWVLKQEHPYRDFVERVATANAELLAAVRDCRRHGGSVAIWGAGARGVTLLVSSRLGPADVAYVVDSDPAKWRKSVPVCGIPIHPPERIRSHPPALVIVATTPNYHDEIVADLRGRHEYRGRIGLLGSGFTILEGRGGEA